MKTPTAKEVIEKGLRVDPPTGVHYDLLLPVLGSGMIWRDYELDALIAAAITQHEQARGVGVESLLEPMREDSNDTQLAIFELACSLGIDAEQRWDHDSCPNNGDIIREIEAEWELVPCDSIRCHEGKLLTRPCPICNDFKTHLRRRINTKEAGE